MAQYLILAETDLRGASQGGKYNSVGPLEEAEALAQFADLRQGRGHELWVDRKNGVRTSEGERCVTVVSRSSLTRGTVVDRYSLLEVL